MVTKLLVDAIVDVVMIFECLAAAYAPWSNAVVRGGSVRQSGNAFSTDGRLFYSDAMRAASETSRNPSLACLDRALSRCV